MYEHFYQLTAEPFRLSPDHRFSFSHYSYKKAKTYMQYAFQRAEGFVMITGRPGTGKSTLVNDLIASMAGQHVDVAKMVCTQLEANDMLRMVANAFKIRTAGVEKSTILQNLGAVLSANHRAGKRTLLIVDEAQDLSQTAMEELRLLTNLQIKSQPLLQIFLLGQQQLLTLMQQPEMEQVQQRLVAVCRIEPLKEEETKAYIIHRLRKSGWQGNPLISDAIYPIVHRVSEGIPRRINLVCSRLLLHGCVEELDRIGVADMKLVLSELQNEQLVPAGAGQDFEFEVEDNFENEGLNNASIAQPAEGKCSEESNSRGARSAAIDTERINRQ